ncbi:hypothetical protein J5N97_023276 [Dioscorea zingiberensis]|uniref:Uncharacterized protein n=1 Tax=Dioscorea zingiberensis TaxID=325984 RepID=A0A9D5HBE7_9LILI|nr:hypothetical protein J5N97_023276 [Dioscorea zingiberensis]
MSRSPSLFLQPCPSGLKVGCGAGNTVFPLIATHPNIFIHACDFSPRAIDLVKCCRTSGRFLSPMVMCFFGNRDYATGDLAQERFTSKEQQISENFYVRGDGTRAYYFSNDYLTNLFKKNGFETAEISIYNKQVENRSRELVMNRRWIQAVFSLNSSSGQGSVDDSSSGSQERDVPRPGEDIHSKDHAADAEIDISESITEMFASSPSTNEVTDIKLKSYSFRIKGLGREPQHTCKSTGLMLWESARFICNLLLENPSIVTGKRVLELGCGSAGICSMVAARSAELVVATDGDDEALNLLKENIAANVEPNLLNKLIVKKLLWGINSDVKDIKDLARDFEAIIGTDVTYNPDAISPLFKTARELISEDRHGEREPALILCHIQRRVDENSILSSASSYGFKLIDRWFNGMESNGGIISSWFSVDDATCNCGLKNAPLTILYFSL